MDSIASASRVLGSRFVLERRLAVGGMGEVWRATDQVLGRAVAVKILRRDLTESDDFLTRFRSEARLAAGLSHPGIAHVYDYAEDVCDDERVAYLVMEFVGGQPLSTRLAQRDHLDDPLDLALVVSILRQTAEAVGAAHDAGIVHRDIKPGNLMITEDGRVKVTDFGIARAMSEAAVTEIGEVIGTVRYMSPEQAMGEEATPASDVYSLAVVGYEMLAARAPFTGDSPAAIALAHVQTPPPELPASVPDELRSLIGQSLAKLPQQRPSDGAEFAAALRDMSISEAPAAPTASIAAAASRPTPTLEMSPTAVSPLPANHLDSARRTVDDRTEIGPTVPPVSEMPLLGHGWVDARRRRRRVAAWATTAVVLASALLLIVVNRGDSPGGNASAADSIAAGTTVAPPDTAVALVTIDPAAYRGLDEAEARAALAAVGLTATTTSAASTADLTGLVIDVQPSGAVAIGSSVTITLGGGTVAPAVDPPPAENPEGGNGNGKDKPKDRGRGNGND